MIQSKKSTPPPAAAQTPPASNRPAGKAVAARQYPKDGFAVWIQIALIQAVVIAIVVGLLVYKFVIAPREFVFFAATPTGQVVPMTPLSEPVSTDPVVLGWAAQAASDVMRFNYRDYKTRMQQNRIYFTEKGWASFELGLDKTKFLETLEANQQILSVVPRESPRFVGRGPVGQVFTWKVEVPLLTTIESNDKSDTKSNTVRLTIVRVPPTENAAGLQIDEWAQGNN